MIGIDVFSGAGGMSLGALSAGIDVRVAIEANRHAATTYQENHPTVEVLATDIANVKDLDRISALRGPKILFGGPPCQGFSTSNQRTRNSLNSKNWLFGEYLRLVRLVNPEWVVFENVRGLIETEGGFFHRSVLNGLQDAGYTTSEWLLNAADFGVPQRRWRLFIIGSRQGKTLVAPEATTSVAVTVKEAINDLPVLLNGASTDIRPYRTLPRSVYAQSLRGDLSECSNHLVTRNASTILERYAHIRKGGNWKQIPPELMETYSDPTRCHTGIYKRLRLDEPSIVIGNFRKNMLIHPTQQRGLSVREAARLQSFPDRFVFTGSIGFQQQQVGNAVPPLLAHQVFCAIQEQQ